MNGPRLGRLLMVAYYFPPIAAAGTHRPMNFSRELERLGWDVVAVTCSDFKENPVDQGLMDRLGAGTRIIRAPSPDLVKQLAKLKGALGRRRQVTRVAGGDAGEVPSRNGGGGRGLLDYLSRLMKTPDSMLSFIPGVVLKSLPMMMGNRPDVLYSTAPPYSCHLAALCLKTLFSVPWVVDFRDPWVDNPFRRNMPYLSLKGLNAYLEKWVVEEASLVITNTPALEEAFRRRYPKLDRFVTLTNGFDPTLVERFKDLAPPRQGGTIRMVHTGEVYGLRSPRGLVSALGEIRRDDPGLFEVFQVDFYGNVHEEQKLMEQARTLGVENAFHCRGQVDHDEALRRLAEADVPLLLGVMGDEPEVQVPSKLFEYLVLKKPILSLSKRGGAIHGILERSGIPFLLADLENADAIKEALCRSARGEWEGGGGWEQVGGFGFDALAERLSQWLTRLKHGEAAV